MRGGLNPLITHDVEITPPSTSRELPLNPVVAVRRSSNVPRTRLLSLVRHDGRSEYKIPRNRRDPSRTKGHARLLIAGPCDLVGMQRMKRARKRTESWHAGWPASGRYSNGIAAKC